MRSRSVAALVVLALSAVPAVPAAMADPTALAACDALVRAAPLGKEGAACLYQAAQQPPLRSAATRRLEALRVSHPASPWPPFYLGYLAWDDHRRSADLYRAAAERFAATGDGGDGGDAGDEVRARTNLYYKLRELGRMAEAGREAERVSAAADASGDPETVACSKVLLAEHLYNSGGDLGRALHLLRRQEEAVFPTGSYFLQREWLSTSANVLLELGHGREARRLFQKLVRRTAEEGDAYAETRARYGLARVAFDAAAEMPGVTEVREARARAQEALGAARAAGHHNVEAQSHFMLAMLAPGEEGAGHARRCLAAAPTERDRSFCLRALARHLAATDPEAARAMLERAFASAREAGDPWALTYYWRERMQLAWLDRPPAEAIAEGLAALAVVEALRDVQRSESGRAELFSTWVEDYHWLSGRLLEAWEASGDAELLAQAFGVTERLRARNLLEDVAVQPAARAGAADPRATALRRRRATLLAELAVLQRRLLDPRLTAARRDAARRRLERLEADEAELRDRLAEPHRRDAAQGFATLAEARRALAADEALLSFQVAPWHDAAGRFAGGAWLLVATRAEARAYRLGGRVELRPQIGTFARLVAGRSGLEARPAAALERRLLSCALAELPPHVDRLVLAADDWLHHLPFGVLRGGPEGAPLAGRYQLTVVPSVTLWLHLRAAPAGPARPALALADPPTLGAATGRWRGRPAERAAVLSAVIDLPRLPHARGEARAVRRHLGRGTELRLGEEASEEYLKRSAGRFGLVHLATHAFVDDQVADRSGVVLAPGTAGEDGLLQVREIADLDLAGAVAVLASCRSASGTVLRGEGVMGLGRAFFQAGARAVVASLWPLRDEEAEALFASFYRHLGEGRTLAAALRAAQQERIAAGAPAAAWAGVVVLGDGEMTPGRGPRAGDGCRTGRLAAGLLAGAAALAGMLLVTGRARRRRNVVG